MSVVRKIVVSDRHGDQHTVYEFQDRRFLRRVRRWKLDNGETLSFDGAIFTTPTGERLLEIKQAPTVAGRAGVSVG